MTIRELAELIGRLVHANAQLTFDVSQPDGMPEKVLDTSRLQKLGWKTSEDLKGFLARTCEWYDTMKTRSEP